MPEVALPPEETMRVALSLADRALIGQFTGLWPSPKTTDSWVQRNWRPLISKNVASYSVGRGYFLFDFESKEDKDLIFRNGPYFMGPQGLYLNGWTPDFDPEADTPKTVPVWVRLPNLPMHCWNSKSLQAIGTALGKYIDMASPKDQYACARICVEVGLEAGLPEAIKLTVGNWSHFQKLDYEQLPFKCRGCQEYGHFIQNCPKKPESHQDKAEGWKRVNRSKSKNQGGGGAKNGESIKETINPPPDGSQETSKTNEPNEVRNEPTDAGEETSNEESKESEAGPFDQHVEDQEEGTDMPKEGEPRGKSEEEFESEEEEEEEGEIELITPRRTKTKGRKSRKEVRDQATYKDKLEGSQPTLEKLLKNTRNTRQQGHAQKGIPTNSKSK